MLQDGIETPLILRQFDISPQRYLHYQCKRRNFLGIYLHIRNWLPECSIHEKSSAFTSMWQPAVPHSSVQPAWASIYIVIHRQANLLHYDSSEWLDMRNATSLIHNIYIEREGERQTYRQTKI